MQHLKIYQNAGNDHDYAQLIPLTPATSFTMTSGCGNQEERALMFAHLRRLPVFRGFSSQLSTFLAYDAEKYWNWYIGDYEEKVRVCDANGSHYLRDMAAALMEKFSEEPDLVEDILDNMRSSDPNRRRLSRPLINRLRMILLFPLCILHIAVDIISRFFHLFFCISFLLKVELLKLLLALLLVN